MMKQLRLGIGAIALSGMSITACHRSTDTREVASDTSTTSSQPSLSSEPDRANSFAPTPVSQPSPSSEQAE